MLAIYKKELKSYFQSMIGYVFMAFLLVVVGIYFYAGNLVQQSGNFEYVLHAVTFIFIILVPILTMRLMSEEKKQKTDQLLFTSAVPVYKIILAKYLAVLTLFAITMLIICLYPVVLMQWGSVPVGNVYASILGFTLLGATFISIGLFISSLTESQVIAAVVSFLIMLLSYLMDSIIGLLPTTNKISSMIILIVLFTAFSYIVYISMRSVVAGVVTWAVGTMAFIALYFVKPDFYDHILTRVLSTVSLVEKFKDFNYGVLGLENIFYYVSISVVFVVLTSLFVKESLSDKQRKGSIFRTSLMVITVVLCVVANLFVSELNISKDISSDGLYSITQKTVDFVEGVQDKLTIYYLVADGNEDPSVEKVVNKYDKLNSNVNVVKKDPVLYPQFTKKYTQEDLYQNSVIVVNETSDKFKVVSYSDMFQFDYDNNGNYDLRGIDVEGQITGAVQFVTTKELSKMYVISGHGETELDDTVKKAVEKQNIEVADLSTLTVSEIPDDCSILVMNGATVDISDDELTMIKVYLKKGGKAIITLAYSTEKTPNIDALLKYYGIFVADGIVAESQGNYAGNYVSNILPQIEENEINSSILESKKYVFLPVCRGLNAKDENPREEATLQSLLTSSQDAYSKVNLESDTLEKEKDDISGPFSYAILATEQIEATESIKEGESQLLVVGTSNLLDSEIVARGQFANLEFFTSVTGSMVDNGNGSAISIPMKSMSQSYLSIPSSQVNIWGALLVIVLPVAILMVGFVIWFNRRRS